MRVGVIAVRDFLTELGPNDRPRLAGACTGTFLLAEAGCLDDHGATLSRLLRPDT